MKKSILLALGLGLAASACHRDEEESFTKATSYPATCQSDPRFNLFLNQYNICSKSDPANADVCLRNDLKSLAEGINSTCKAEPSTRSLFGKALLKLVRIVWSGVKDDATQESALKLTTFWLTNYRPYYLNPGQPLTDDIQPLERAIQDALRDENARLAKLELDGYSKEIQNYADSGAVSENGLYLDARINFLDRTISAVTNTNPSLPADAAALLTANSFNSVLETLVPRLTYAANIHDLACAAIQCRPSDLTDYDYMRTFRFLSLLNRGSYGEAKAIVDLGPATRIRNSLFLNENLLRTMLETLTAFEAGRLTGARPSDLARDIKQTLSMADDLYQRQQRLGYFFTNDSRTLLFSFSPSARLAAQSLLSSIKLSLDSARSDLKGNREAVYVAIRDGLGKDLQLSDVASTKIVSEAMLAELNEDILGLRKAVTEQDKNLANFTTELQKLADRNSAYIGSRMMFTDLGGFAVSAADAKYTANTPVVGPDSDIPSLAVKKFDLAKGQILNLNIDNSWAPVCALKKTVEGQAIDVSALKVGPDGFMRVQDQGKSTIDTVEHSNSDSVSTGTTNSKTWCDSMNAGGSLGLGGQKAFDDGEGGTGSASAQIGVGRSATTNTCYGKETTRRHTVTDTVSHAESTSFRDGASFQSGIRFQDTPFPSMPGGTLLAIVLPQGATTAKDRIQAQVLDRKASIVAGQDESVYIVVNDCKDATSTTAGGSLSLQAGLLKPAGGELVNLMPALGEEIARFSVEAEKLLSEGKDISAQIETLKSNAYTRNSGRLSEPEAAAIFNYGISYAATRIDRLAKIQEKNREIARLQIDLLKLAKSEDLLRSEKALVQSRLKNLVDEFSFMAIGDRAASASGDMQKYVMPFLAFLEAPRNTLLTSAKNLAMSASLAKHPSTALGEISSLANEINNLMIKDGGLISSTPSESYVAVRIPNPELKTPAKFDIPTLDRARAEAFWRGIFLSTESSTTLNIMPEDLYNSGRDLSLNCGDGKPVITNMALVFLTDEDSVNETSMDELNSFKNLTMTLGMDMFYPSPSQDLRFRLNKPTDGNVKTKLGYASPKRFGKAITSLFDSRKLTNSGDGLSPFTGISINRQNANDLKEEVASQAFFKAPAKCTSSTVDEDAPGSSSEEMPCLQYPENLTDLVLVFSLRYNSQYSPSDFKWIRTCRQ